MNRNYRDQEFLTKVGARIVEIRKQKHITQEKLTELTQLDLRQIGRIERAETNSNLSLIKLIADALDIDVSELFKT